MKRAGKNMNNYKKIINICMGLHLLLFSLQICFADGSQKKAVMVLTEKEAIEIALKNNYDILSKKEDIRVADARLSQARSQVFPYIIANANYTSYEDHPYITFEDNRGYSFSATQLLFAGGRVVNTIDAARKGFEAVKTSKKELENKIIYSTKHAFYSVILAKEVVGIRKETLELAEENLTITRKRYKKGEASHYDFLRSKVEIANIRPQLIKAENLLMASYNFLKILLGIDSIQKIEVKGEFNYTPEDFDLNKEMAIALETRPALEEIALQEKAAQAQVEAAFSGYLPEVRLNFTDYANQKEPFSEGREKYDDYWIGGIVVSVPVFDGFLTRSKISEAKAKEEKVRILKDKLRHNVKIEVENVILDLEAAQETVESQEENVAMARDAYEIIRQRYALGEATQLDLLDVHVALSTAQLNYTQGLYDFIIARAKLNYVVGREK